MICEYTVKKYCCEDFSLIENYDKAMADSKTWHCHHRKETDEKISVKRLKAMGLYLKRPASELIFLPPEIHQRLDRQDYVPWNKGKKMSAEFCEKTSIRMKGNQINKGRKQSDEERDKRSKAQRKRFEKQEEHDKASVTTKKLWESQEYREKQSLSQKGIKKPGTSEKLKNVQKQKYYWLTPNGETKIMNAAPVKRFHQDWVLIGVAV